MINEVLFRYEERLFCPIQPVALDTDIKIFRGHFGENTYYADLAGIARKYRPHSVLEIGCRYGYSAYAFAFGAKAGGVSEMRFLGIDAEHYNYRSNAVAAENLRRFAPWVTAWFYTHDSSYGLPKEITDPRITGRSQSFDLINVDGDHTYVGTMRDLRNVWPHLNEGGILIVDDIKMEEVLHAVRMFMHDLRQAGHGFIWQLHENETNLILIQKRSDLAPPSPEPVAPPDPETGFPPGVVGGHIEVLRLSEPPPSEPVHGDWTERPDTFNEIETIHGEPLPEGDRPELPVLTPEQAETFEVGISKPKKTRGRPKNG